MIRFLELRLYRCVQYGKPVVGRAKCTEMCGERGEMTDTLVDSCDYEAFTTLSFCYAEFGMVGTRCSAKWLSAACHFFLFFCFLSSCLFVRFLCCRMRYPRNGYGEDKACGSST